MRSADRRRQRQFEKAYAEAWAARQRTTDDSDELLLAALRKHQVDLGPAHDLLLDMWRRGTPPHAVTAEALNAGLTLAAPVVDALMAIADTLEGARPVDLTQLPGSRQRLSHEPHWTMQRLPVVYAKPATAYLGTLDLPVANTRTGERAAQVWLLPAEQPIADVMVGEVSIGTVRLTDPTWHRLREEESRNTFADGIVYCWPIGPGILEPDALLCTLPNG